MSEELSRRCHQLWADVSPAITSALGCCAAMLFTAPAAAAQGPGVSPGTASPTLQVAMALLVYGSSLGIVIAGVIGAARRR